MREGLRAYASASGNVVRLLDFASRAQRTLKQMDRTSSNLRLAKTWELLTPAVYTVQSLKRVMGHGQIENHHNRFLAKAWPDPDLR